MTATEVIGASDNRTWKENSIYIIMNTLIRKGAVVLAHHKPTVTNSARAYKPALTSEQYMVRYVKSTKEAGVPINIQTLIEGLMEVEEG